MKVCSIEGCGGTFKINKGLCNKHYIRMRRHGTTEATRTERGATRDFINGLIGHEGKECVLWPFARDVVGYARIRHDGDNYPAYRLVCELAHGPAPKDAKYHATHTCGNGPNGCVNPNHLEWGTAFKNQQDRTDHGTSNRGEQCAAHKLTEDEALEIFNRLNAGERPYLLAKEFKVNYVTVHDIKSGRSWAWLTGLPNPKARDAFGNLVAANDNTKQEMAA